MSRGRKPIILANDIRDEFCVEWFGKEEPSMWPLWVDDIVSGVARLDWYGSREQQIPLSTASIIRCFTSLKEISTESVMELLEVKKSMASLYVKACKLCYPHFKRCLSNQEILRMKYPRQSIVSEAHGVALGYHKPNKALI
ncbi:hypothetical protein D3C86_1460070 [compost metagenome]